MGIKNANFGKIDSSGGNIQLGDNHITNVFEGLIHLHTEFKEQLKDIENLLNTFKPKTALELLTNLEGRILDLKIEDRDKILSKVLFLKALCKREVDKSSVVSSANDFIKASNLNSQDEILRDRACVEYLNIGEEKRALEKANEIILIDEFNRAAWFVKAIVEKDITTTIKLIPLSVLNDYNFRLSIIYQIISTKNLSNFDQLSEYNLVLDIDFEKYTNLTFNDLEAWRLAIDLSINKFFNDFPLRYVSGKYFIFENNVLLEKVFNLIKFYITKLKNTELHDKLTHQDFFYNYFGYLLTNEENFYINLKKIYDHSETPIWIYTLSICQILNHKELYNESLQNIVEYENLHGILNSEFYLFKSTLYYLTGKVDEIENIFDNYLKSIDLIEERNGFNILNAFVHILYQKVDNKVLRDQLVKILNKNFKSEELKKLLELTISIRYIKEFDVDTAFSVLSSLKEYTEFDINWKSLITEDLNAIGKRNDAIEFLESYLDKSQISESLRLFIFFIHEQLCDKNDINVGRYDEILELLKFWRLNSNSVDEELLKFEHNLYTEINDLESLEEIDSYLFRMFPDNKQYILSYLNVLERTKNYDKILEVTNKVPLIVDDERFGVAISSILLRNKIGTEKGFEILYNLASNPNNTTARKNYFFNSLMFREFFINYETVILNCWVSYRIGDKIEKVKIEKEHGFQQKFLAKKVGDKFTNITKLTNKTFEVEILEIFNDAVNLHHEIMAEASNPANELGFESFNLPPESKDFTSFFQGLFGSQGSEEKEKRDQFLDDYFNYRIGFSEISRTVFRQNYVDAYLHLCGYKENRFTTLPSKVTKDIENNKRGGITFGLDLSSLILFYFLENELSFKFNHKFTISYLSKIEIEKEIVELNNSPFSKMSVEITNESFTKYFTPENYREKRIEFLNSISKWIEINCNVDLVKEKLKILPKFDQKEKLDDFMKLLIDNMCLSDRQNFHLISNDSTLFLFANKSCINNNITNPEKFLTTFYPENCNTNFSRFLLKSNYLGINISYETIKNEFHELILGKENYYNLCVENLKYSIHNNPNIIVDVSLFLKHLYLINTLTTEIKNKYSLNLITNVITGMPPDIRLKLYDKINCEFKLMGNFNLEINKILLIAFR